MPSTPPFLRSPLIEDLHVNSVRIFDVQTRVGVVQRVRSALYQIAGSRFLAETGYADCKVIHNTRRALTVEGDQCPVGAEADNSKRLVLANDRETEHFLVKIDGMLQIRDLNAHMINVRTLEFQVFLGGGRRSAGSQHRETADQFSTAERALLEASREIRNDRFHGDFLSRKVNVAAEV